MPKLVKVIERHYRVKVIIDQPELKEKHYSGTIDLTEPLEVFLNDLEQINSIRCRYDEDRVLHLWSP